jgi:hypothetical protein
VEKKPTRRQLAPLLSSTCILSLTITFDGFYL